MSEQNRTLPASRLQPIPALDGLRALACLGVLFLHQMELGLPALPDVCGHNAVNLFFTLSGFLMASHYLPGKLAWRYWAAFLTRRFFRVYAVFAIMMGIYWLCNQLGVTILYYDHFDVKRLLSQLLLRHDIFTYWTITVEVKFYLLFPCIAAALLFLRVSPQISFCLLTLVWCWLLSLDLFHNIDDFLSLWKNIPYFVGGMWAASAVQLFDLRRFMTETQWSRVLLICILLAIPFAYLPPGGIFNKYSAAFLYTDRFISPLMAILIIAAAHAREGITWLLTNRLMRFIGAISYSLYVCHRFIFGLGILWFPKPSIVLAYSIVAYTFLFAWAFHRTIEKPLNAHGKKLSRKINASISH